MEKIRQETIYSRIFLSFSGDTMEKPHKAEIFDLLITLENSPKTIFGMLKVTQGVHNFITLLP